MTLRFTFLNLTIVPNDCRVLLISVPFPEVVFLFVRDLGCELTSISSPSLVVVHTGAVKQDIDRMFWS